MSAVSIELPESLYKQVQELADQGGIMLEHFVALTVAEKMASLRTL